MASRQALELLRRAGEVVANLGQRARVERLCADDVEDEAADPGLGFLVLMRIGREAGQELFGDWLVEVTFGRIGPGGRTVRYVAAEEEGARILARACLRRRASARRRIGVAYRELSRYDPNEWTDR